MFTGQLNGGNFLIEVLFSWLIEVLFSFLDFSLCQIDKNLARTLYSQKI